MGQVDPLEGGNDSLSDARTGAFNRGFGSAEAQNAASNPGMSPRNPAQLAQVRELG